MNASESPDNLSRLEALLEEHWERLCTLVFRLVGDRGRAEDIVLEAFTRLYERPPQKAENPSGWLYRVALRLGLNALRAESRRRHYEARAAQEGYGAQAAQNDVERIYEQLEERAQVRRVLSKMKTREAQLLLLYHAGFRYAEIAGLLGLSLHSIGTLLARAEKTFEKIYRQEYASSLSFDEG